MPMCTPSQGLYRSHDSPVTLVLGSVLRMSMAHVNSACVVALCDGDRSRRWGFSDLRDLKSSFGPGLVTRFLEPRLSCL